MARSALSFVVFGWLTLLPAARASAEEVPKGVRLQIDDCPDGTLKLVDAYQAARLELEQAGITSVQDDSGATEAQGELTARLRCERGVEAVLKLRVRDEASSASRVISLNDANPKDRPRLLGLALAELVRSDWSDLVERSRAVDAGAAKAANGSPPAAAAVAEAPMAAPAAVSAKSAKSAETTARDTGAVEQTPSGAASDPPHLAFSVDAILRWFTAAPGPTLGAGFGLERGWFSVGLEAAVGRHVAARGTANYGLGAATLGAAVLQAASRRGRLTLGPKVALGGTWATGDTSQPDVVASGTGGLYADARVEATAALRLSPLELVCRLNGGRAAGLSLTDGGAVIGATGGWFLGGALGARW